MRPRIDWRMVGALGTATRGIAAAVRHRPWVTLGVSGASVVLDVALPVLLLSIVKKPWTYFAVNPWLAHLPEYLVSDVALPRKVGFLSRMALFWFTADGPYGEPEWGFTVDVPDVARFLVVGALIGLYFALWLHLRDHGRRAAWQRRGGTAGALLGVVGLSTGPCSVMGCGAPVMPVVGLAFAGLSSTTLAWLSELSVVAIAVVIAGLAAAVAWFGWRAGRITPVPRGMPTPPVPGASRSAP